MKPEHCVCRTDDADATHTCLPQLTITSFCAIYLTMDRSELALLGPSKDYGYGGFYFVLTQSVVVMEYLAGAGSGDDLAVNRIVANITVCN